MNSLAAQDKGLVVGCLHCGQRNRISYEKLAEKFRCGHCHKDIPAPDEPVELLHETVFRSITANSTLPVLIDFWAPWCGPCKMVAPELVKVAKEGAGKWLVAKVDTEALPAPARQFKITAIPTLVLFKSGREVARQSGAMGAAAIKRFIEQYL